MIASENAINLIKEFEGCRLESYKCPSGVWTVGYGHTFEVTASTKISQEEADTLLKEDVAIYSNHVNNLNNERINIGYDSFNQNEFDALVSFCYNCGDGNLRKLCKGRNKKQISDAILLYNKASGRELKGLKRRREAEKKLFDTEFFIPEKKVEYDSIRQDISLTLVACIGYLTDDDCSEESMEALSNTLIKCSRILYDATVKYYEKD